MNDTTQELTQFQLFIFRQRRCRAELIKDVIITFIISLKHDPEHTIHLTVHTEDLINAISETHKYAKSSIGNIMDSLLRPLF